MQAPHQNRLTMIRALSVLLLLTTASAFAADKAVPDPAALVKARKAYDAKVKAAVDPITAAYLKHLEGMKKAYDGKRDVVAAQAVQNEIDSLTTTMSLVGKWTWGGEGTAEFWEDGSCTHSSGSTGKWTCVDKKTRKYRVSWSSGYLNRLLMSADGTTILGKNNKGETWTAQRLREQ